MQLLGLAVLVFLLADAGFQFDIVRQDRVLLLVFVLPLGGYLLQDGV